MKTHLLRWALLCVAATPGLLQLSSAEASHTVVIKRGDNIHSLARRYNISVKDIARANNISADAMLRDGRKLIIPDPPKRVVRPATMRRAATIRGNRIAVRLGPDENYRRVILLDDGAALIVTRKAGDWFQVETEAGKKGRARGDFLSLGKRVQSAETRTVRKFTRTASAKTSGKHSRKVARQEEAQRSKRNRQTAQKEERRTSKRTRTARVTSERSRKQKVATQRHTHRRISQREEQREERSSSEQTRSERSPDIIRTAFAYRGVPYSFGGTSRRGFDCSGFTRHIYSRKGVQLPHSARGQYSTGKPVPKGDMKPGDLVFFHTTRPGISHVGIYSGNGKFVHASSGGGKVQVDSLNSGYYNQRFVGARRVK